MTITLAAWLHDLSPFALRISGNFGIRWYGLSYALGFLCAWLALRFLHKRGMALIPRERLTDAIIYAAMGAVVGGRLGYILFYQPELLWMFEKSPPFWGVLMLNHGGMASHGGMIGVIIAGVLISRGARTESGERVGKAPVLHVFDLYALIAPFGLMLGRIANFINGELLGKVVALPGEEAPWWAVRFPQEIGSGHDAGLRSPAQDRALDQLISDYSLPSHSPGESLELVLTKLQAGSTEIAQRLEPLLSARHPSQLYQAFAEGIVLGSILWFVARKPRKPGVLTALFLICYGLLRIATEFVRLPDPGVAGFAGLSRGQLLSAGMILVGLALLVWVSRTKNGFHSVQGWSSRQNGTAPEPKVTLSKRWVDHASGICRTYQRNQGDQHGFVYIEALEKYGYSCHDAARELLMRFGGMTIPVTLEGKKPAVVWKLHLDPRRFLGELMPEEVGELSRRIDRRLIPVGEESGGGDVYCDEHGWLWYARDGQVIKSGHGVQGAISKQLELLCRS